MHSIATCPQCAAQLALPSAATATDYAVCPECKAEFCLADGDQRWLATAELIPPPEPTESELPEPETIPVDEPVEPVSLSSQQTVEFEEPPLPSPAVLEETEAESSEAEEPERVSLDDLAVDPKSAETLVSTSALSDWEERLRSVIDTPAEQEDESQAEHQSASAEKTPLEEAPEFDFHMDPPAEKPAEHQEVPAEELTKTAEWFQSTSVENVESVESTEPLASESELELPSPEPQKPEPVEPVAAVSAVAPLRKRRQKNSLMRLATVFTLFGVVGLLLGQYALLWLYGPPADYIGLTAIVPRSVIPGPTSHLLAPQITPTQGLATEALAEQAAEPEGDSTDPATDERLANQGAASPLVNDEIIRDDSVIAATAELPTQPSAEVSPSIVLLPSTGTTTAEFAELVQAARDALPGLIEGDIDSKEARGRKGQAYIALCQLAERFDFANSNSGSATDTDLANAARSMFHSLADETSVHNHLAYITQKWWGYDQRPNSGIVLFGRIEAADQQEGFTVYQLRLAGSDSELIIPVAVAGAEHRLGDTIGVVGTVVADPGRSLPDFSLDLPQVVVAPFTFGY